jgi:hypothetical protein
MNQQNFTYSIVVPATAREVFEKIGRVWDWWAVNFKGRAGGLHDEFTVHFARTTWSRMEIVDIVPDTWILWKVADCYLPIFSDPYLWRHHFISWEISAEGASTRLTMTHIGLIPGVECYEDCSKGWSFYVGESLYKLLTEDRGLPGSGIFAEVVIGDRRYEGLLFARAEAFPKASPGSIVIDVKENQGERVLSAWSVNVLTCMEPGHLKGDYYMIVENPPAAEGASFVEDLFKIID